MAAPRQALEALKQQASLQAKWAHVLQLAASIALHSEGGGHRSGSALQFQPDEKKRWIY
ncbi:MAG: hypothetical protein KIT40_13960 [Nitrospira sp.]|nr:hypothetical protein [Nitrospira sp.]